MCAHVIKVCGNGTGLVIMSTPTVPTCHDAVKSSSRKEGEGGKREERALENPATKEKVVKYDRRTQLGRRKKVNRSNI